MGVAAPVNAQGGYDLAVQGNYGVVIANGYLLAGFSVVTSATSAVLELRTFIAFRSLTKSRQREQRDEFRLLIYSMACFVAHLLMSYSYVCMYFFGGQMVVSMMLVVDILCFSDPLCLFVTSKSVRIGYIRFVGLGRLTTSKKVSLVFEVRSGNKTTTARESSTRPKVQRRC